MTQAVHGLGSGPEGWMARGESTPEAGPVRRPESSEEPNASPGAFERMVRAMGKEIDQGESRVRQALSGAATRSYSSVDLIVLQAGIYRYTEAVDLAARLVDRAGQAIKTTLHSSSG
jgi:hypothetical protein